MQTIILDGKEYVLVPREQLREVPQPAQTTPPQPPQTSLDDFLVDNGTEIVPPPVDDGLADNKEKQGAIRVVEQEVITAQPLSAPPARSRPYEYRQRFLRKEVLPSDIMTFSRLSQSMIDANPEDPFIKADAKKPKSKQLFYGPGSEQE